MVSSGYSGWYLAVQRVGTLQAGEQATVELGPRQTPVASLLRRHRQL